MWIYERYDWMNFTWDKDQISALAENDRSGATAEILTQDIVSSFRIEGFSLNTGDVRSSVIKRLGATNALTSGTSSHFMEGVVDMIHVLSIFVFIYAYI